MPTSRQEPPQLDELATSSAEHPREEKQPVGDSPPPPNDWLAPLHNRLIIGGIAILILLALTSMVLLVFSSGDSDLQTGTSVAAVGNDDTTPAPDTALTATALRNVTMYNGPGTNYPPVSLVRRGARVPIIGRNADGTWLQVVYPPGSAIQGWIAALFLNVNGDLVDVVIGGPGNRPSIVVPTSVPTFASEKPFDTPIPPDVPVDKPTDVPADTPDAGPTDTPVPEPTDTPPPIEPPAPTATPVPLPTEPPVDVPDEKSPNLGKSQASADRLTPPATLIRKPQLSMLPSGVPPNPTPL
jgi:uncharacterized protein YraI